MFFHESVYHLVTIKNMRWTVRSCLEAGFYDEAGVPRRVDWYSDTERDILYSCVARANMSGRADVIYRVPSLICMPRDLPCRAPVIAIDVTDFPRGDMCV